MFYNYPVEATQQNWVSEALIGAVTLAVNKLREGSTAPKFKDAIKGEHRAQFLVGSKFQELYDKFVDRCKGLAPADLSQVSAALLDQNNIPGVYKSIVSCCSIKNTLPEVHEAAKQLFEHAFEKLSVWKTPGSTITVRASYHQLVDSHLSHGSCPFCGYEPLEAPDPDLVNPDLDHYLAISIYPFAGVNLRNLTAMGAVCNRSYKGAQDILFDEDNQRVDCLDPYGNEQVSVSLKGTTILSDAGGGPKWVIQFNPDAGSHNWRRIFELESRLRSNVLERHHRRWLKDFITYSREKDIDVSTKEGALNAVEQFICVCGFETFPVIAQLKTSFFDLVHSALTDPAQVDRMHNFLLNLKSM